MTVERLPSGFIVTKLQKILSLSNAYSNPLVPTPVEGMTRDLQVAPVLFKEATRPDRPKYIGAQKRVASMISRLPHVSELESW